MRNSGSIPESGKSPGGGQGNPLQYSCLENPLDMGAWQATVHRVTKSQTWLMTQHTCPRAHSALVHRACYHSSPWQHRYGCSLFHHSLSNAHLVLLLVFIITNTTWISTQHLNLGICSLWAHNLQPCQTGSTHDETSQSLAPVSQDMSFDVISNAGNTNQSPCPFLSL